MLKPYVLFAGMQYDELGGWHDFAGSYETLEVAKAATTVDERGWAHIVAHSTGEILLTWQHSTAAFAKQYKAYPSQPEGWFTNDELKQREAAWIAGARKERESR